MAKAPDPPDPYKVAAAQTQSNKDTASYNAALNRINTNSPLGSSAYTQHGTDPTTGAPIYQQDITLSPGQQQLYDSQLKQSNDITSLGNALTPQIAASFNRGITDGAASGQAAQDAYYGKEKAYLDPQFGQQQNDMEAKLANQGIVQGSQAAERSQGDFDRSRAFAYGQAQNQAISSGQDAQARSIANQTAVNAAPLNQLASLRSGTPVSMPQFQGQAQSNAAGTDIGGLIEKNYAQQSANANNFNSGLFSLAGAATSMFDPIKLSDRRLKRNIIRVGTTRALGLPIYEYDYVWGGGRQQGVMADEVAKVIPCAVVTMPDGYKAVNYGLVG